MRPLPPVATLLLVGVLWAMPDGAMAEAPWEPATVRSQRANRHATALEARLRALDTVTEAHARVRLPAPLTGPLDAPPPGPWVQLSLGATPGANRAELEALATRLAADEVAGGAPLDVDVRWLTPPPLAPAPLARVGPFEVAPGSAAWLRATLLALLATGFVLAALLLGYLRRDSGPPRAD